MLNKPEQALWTHSTTIACLLQVVPSFMMGLRQHPDALEAMKLNKEHVLNTPAELWGSGLAQALFGAFSGVSDKVEVLQWIARGPDAFLQALVCPKLGITLATATDIIARAVALGKVSRCSMSAPTPSPCLKRCARPIPSALYFRS